MGIKILLVDDEEFLRKITTVEILNRLDADISEASSVDEAQSLLEAGAHFDVIISDYCMPKRNGNELLEFIYKNGLFTLFVFFTSYDEIKLPQTDKLFLGIIEKMEYKKLIDTIKFGLNSIPNK